MEALGRYGISHYGSIPKGELAQGGHKDVKGDKAVLEVEYSAATALPTQFFVKFQLQANLPVRLLCEATEAARIEAHFYNRVADQLPTSLRAPRFHLAITASPAALHVREPHVVPLAVVRRGLRLVVGWRKRTRATRHVEGFKGYALGTL